MSKITLRQTFKRFWNKEQQRLMTSKVFDQHNMVTEVPPFQYRAPHAPRPTAPRKRFDLKRAA